MSDPELEERIEDLLVKGIIPVMSNIEYGDPLPEMTEDITREIDALTTGMSPWEFRVVYDRCTERAYKRVLEILRMKALPEGSLPT